MTIFDVRQNLFNSAKKDDKKIKNRNSGNFSGAGSMEIKIVSEMKEFLELKDSWKEITENSDTTIFQTYIWNKTWWKYFGEGKTLFILTIYEDGKLVGIFPGFLDDIHFFGRRIYSCLRLLGTTVFQPQGEELKGLKIYSDYMDMIVRPGYGSKVGAALTAFFFNSEPEPPFDEVVLEEIREDSHISKWLLPCMDNKNIRYSSEDQSACPVTPLEPTWEKYLATMSKRRRNHARKYIRYVEDPEIKTYNFERAETAEQVNSLFQKLTDLHQKHWNTLGQPGVFKEKRYFLFLKEAVQLFFEEGNLWLHGINSLEDNNKTVAVDLHLVHKKRICLLQRAYDSGPEIKAGSPGTVLLYNSLLHGIKHNYELFDFLRGEDSYKYRTANTTLQNKKYIIPLSDTGLLPKAAKTYPGVKRKILLEAEKAKIVFRGKPIHMALKDYIQYTVNRFKSVV